MSRMKDMMNTQAERLFNEFHLMLRAESIALLINYTRWPERLAAASTECRTRIECAFAGVYAEQPEIVEAMCEQYYELPTMAVVSEIWQDYLNVLANVVSDYNLLDGHGLDELLMRINAHHPSYTAQYADSTSDQPDVPYLKTVEDELWHLMHMRYEQEYLAEAQEPKRRRVHYTNTPDNPINFPQR